MADCARASGALRFLYNTPPGRALLKLLTAPRLSRAAGAYLDSGRSRWLIPRFVRSQHIDLSRYEDVAYASFNDFFTRRLRREQLKIDAVPDSLIAPCDGRLSAFRVADDAVFFIKGSRYTLFDLLGGDPEAGRFRGGLCLVFRLGVDDYHRYCYFDDGTKGDNVFIPGRLHTVQPIALARYPVFIQNSREYCLLRTRNFGTACQIEVGALLVGRICNLHGACAFRRGEEKGRFEYGGSTIVLLLEPGRAALPEELFESSARGVETRVRCGQRLGRAVGAADGGEAAPLA